MPIKRDTIGRKYTERQILRQVGEPTEEDRQLAQAAWDRQREAALSPHHNFNAVVAWATAQLEESGLPSGRYELMGPPTMPKNGRAKKTGTGRWSGTRTRYCFRPWRQEHGTSAASTSALWMSASRWAISIVRRARSPVRLKSRAPAVPRPSSPRSAKRRARKRRAGGSKRRCGGRSIPCGARPTWPGGSLLTTCSLAGRPSPT
jgi:hypothetical protein